MQLRTNAVMTTVLALYDQSLRDLTTTLESVPDADFALTLGGIVTHPAWTLSHCCGSAELICRLLDTDGGSNRPALFAANGPGSQPTSQRSDYLAKATLLTTLHDLHRQATAAVQSAHPDVLARVPPKPFDGFAPTIGDIVIYLLAAHESYHLSLMVTWHRLWSQRKTMPES